MAEINALYPQPPAPQQQQGLLQQNPLALIPAIGQIQELTARQNIGDAYRRNTKPDGTLDQQGLMRDLSTTGGFKAGEAVGQGISNQSALIDQRNKQAAVMNDVIGSLPPNASTDEIISRLTWISTHYPPDVMPPALINQAIRDLSNPASRSQRILEARDRAMGVQGVAKEAQTGLDPRTGEIIAGTEQQRQRQLAGAGGGTMAPGAVRGAPGIAKTLPVGTEESTKDFQSALRKAGNYQQEIFPWLQAQEKAKELGPGATGPGTKGRQELESFVYGLAPKIAASLGIVNPEKIKNYAELEKYLTQGLQGRAENYGPKTNDSLATAISGTPNVHINDLAVGELIQATVAMRKFEQAQIQANKQHGPVSYAARAADWASKRDPRAYAFDTMTPEAIAKLDKSLKGAERAKFNATIKEGRELGLIGDRQ